MMSLLSGYLFVSKKAQGFVIPSPSPSAKDERLQIITYIYLLSCGSLAELSSADVYLSYRPTNLDRRRKRTAPFLVEGNPSTPILPSPLFSLGARLASRAPPTSGVGDTPSPVGPIRGLVQCLLFYDLRPVSCLVFDDGIFLLTTYHNSLPGNQWEGWGLLHPISTSRLG